MKSRKEILTDFMNMTGTYKTNFINFQKSFFLLNDGEICLGEIELIHDNLVQFSPDWDEALKNHNYQRYEEDECLQYILIPLEDIDINHLYYWNKKSSSFVNVKWIQTDNDWVHIETKPGSIPLPKFFLKSRKDDKSLKQVGYWQSEERPYLAHPKYLVEPGWRENERSKIITYLKSGHKCGHWCGFSYCRFGCFSQRPDKNKNHLEYIKWRDGIYSMGCFDLTDGQWVWPQGLAHYVENHDICLPNQFIDTMEENSWLIPSKIDFKHYSEVGINTSYWIGWTLDYVKSKKI